MANFYYLREFSTDLQFNNLTVTERMILSALLTKNINHDDRNLVEIIMNFTGNNNYTNYTSWLNYKAFAEEITNFLNDKKGKISDYMLENFKDRKLIHYVTINYEDLKINNKSSLSNIACKAFILGCANHSCNDNNDWFRFHIQYWWKYAMNKRKQTLKDIDEFMKDFNISYTFNKNSNFIVISNKKAQNNLVKPTPINDEKIETVEKVKETPIVEETEISALNLGDETRLNKNLIVDYIENNGLEISNSANTKNTELIRQFTDSKCYKNYISKLMSGKANQDIIDTYNGCYIKGDDGLERKKNAEQQIKVIQEAVINSLTKLYDFDEDHSRYYVILNYICRNFAKLFTNF